MQFIMAFSIIFILFSPIDCMADPFQCLEGDCTKGFGTYELPVGAKYIGNFKDRKYHGKGTYIFPSGTKIIGTWIDGKQEGKSTVIFPDGKTDYVYCKGGNCSKEYNTEK